VTTLDRELHTTAENARREAQERTVRELFDLRAKGDIDAILERFAPNFVYNPRGDWSQPPFAPGPCDRETFAEAMRLVNVEYQELATEIHELLIDGERVAAHRTVKMRNRGAGAAVDIEELDVFRFRNGLVAEFACYVDAAKLAELEELGFVAANRM
jgi:ketosteroid isomerase-like protein